VKNIFKIIILAVRNVYVECCIISKTLRRNKVVMNAAATLGAITLYFAVSTIAGFLTHYQSLIVFNGILAGIILICLFSFGNFSGELLGKVAGILSKKLASAAGTVTGEVRKLFAPLCTVSLICVFISFVVQINGFNLLFGWAPLNLVAIIALFFSILGVYNGTKKKWPGIVMTTMIVLMLVPFYTAKSHDPVATFVRSHTRSWSKSSHDNGLRNAVENDKTIGMVIDDSTVLFNKNSVKVGNLTVAKTIAQGSALKIVSPENEGTDTDVGKLLTVRQVNSHGIFIGDTFFVNPGTVVWGKAEYTSKYLMVQADGVEYLAFYTDEPIQISTKNLYHKTVDFSTFKEGDLKWNNIGQGDWRKGADDAGMNTVTPGVTQYNFCRKACTFQAYSGFLLKIYFS
jgi:hypothetical protein